MDYEELKKNYSQMKGLQKDFSNIAREISNLWDTIDNAMGVTKNDSSIFDYCYPFDMDPSALSIEIEKWKDKTEALFAEYLRQNEWKQKKVIMHATSNVDDWYSVILSEICSVCRYGDRKLAEFAHELWNQFMQISWNDPSTHEVYITANETNVVTNEKFVPKNIGDGGNDLHDKTERYYHLVMKPIGDAIFVELEKGELK